jgi:hypothetical protein
MPTITAQSIIDKAQIILQDTTGIRWPEETELLGWLNDGQREVAILRPDASTVTANMTTVAGTKQSLPAAGTALVNVMRTVGGNAIRKVPQEILDAQRPGWHAESSGAAKHYTYDPRTPRIFYVYPPSAGSVQLEIKYQAAPADVATIGGTITIDDVYANALIDYILFRAYSKDAEYTANDGRAMAARKSFENTLGLKAVADASAQPANNTAG